MKTSSVALTIVVAASLVGGCTEDPTFGLVPSTLTKAASCEQLLSTLKEDALVQMNGEIDARIAAIENRDSSWFGFGSMDESAMAPSGTGGSSAVDDHDYSETNIQVEGVDEADIVKTDGYHLFIVHGSELVIADAWPAADLSLASTTPIEGRTRELFLAGDKVVVYSDMDGSTIYSQAGVQPPQRPYSGYSSSSWGAEPFDPYGGYGMTKITVLGLQGTDGTETTVLAEHYFEGRYLTSRRIDNQVRTVLQGGHQAPAFTTWLTTGYSDEDDEIDALEQLREHNKAIIESATTESFLPRRFVKQGSALTVEPTSCQDFYLPTIGTTRYGLTQIHALDLDALHYGVEDTYVIGDTYAVYSSHEGMYLATRFWANPLWSYYESEELEPRDGTHVHKFDIASQPAKPKYVASGTVPGQVHNQFSLDERDGLLRLATTVRLRSETDSRVESNMYVLAQSGGSLAAIGALTGIAPGEEISSVRFLGDRGYIVTALVVVFQDPLFVIDLSTPSAPTLLGELHIPGFAEYVHPLEDGDFLLTVGTEDWGSMALQIYDVRDDTSPELIHKLVLDGTSEAQTDHKAFTFFQGMLAIPFTSFWGSWQSELRLFDIDTELGIKGLGSIDHSSLFGGVGESGYSCGYSTGVRRGVFIEDHVYSISPGGVLANYISEAHELNEEPVASLSLPEPVGTCYY